MAQCSPWCRLRSRRAASSLSSRRAVALARRARLCQAGERLLDRAPGIAAAVHQRPLHGPLAGA
eukprot:3062512-Pyramimonas_sp.AAC.1